MLSRTTIKMACRGRVQGNESETINRRKRRVSELLSNILKGFDLARENPLLGLSVRDVKSNPNLVITKPSSNDDSGNTTDASSRSNGSTLRSCDDRIEDSARLSTKPRSYSMENHNKVVPISPKSTLKSLSVPSSPSTQYWSRDLKVEEEILNHLRARNIDETNMRT